MNKILNAIACKEPKRLVKPILWGALVNLSSLLPFLCLAYIVDQIYEYFIHGPGNSKSMWIAWGFVLVFFDLTWFSENIVYKSTYRDGFIASADGRIKLAEHIRKLPLGFPTSRNADEAGNTMVNDFSRIESAMTYILPQIISGVIMAILASALLLIVDFRIGLVMFAGFSTALLIMLGMRGLEQRLGIRLSKARVSQAGKIRECLSGMRVIKSYSMRGSNFERLRKACTDCRGACIKVESGIGSLNLVAAAFLRSGLSLMTVTGVFLMARGTLTVPTSALFLLVSTRVFDPLAVVIMNYSELMMYSMTGERICTLLNEPEMAGNSDVPGKHEICSEHVSFSYSGAETQEVLHDVSVRPGSRTMTTTVGPSGSGKSTMPRLLAHFYDPTFGKVLLGGVDERNIEPEKLMKYISMVFQDVYLFQDSVVNNIRYRKEDATQEEIENVARLADCYDFIMRISDGFETITGEGGSTLSGSEKQRISIARVILKGAPIVLLDEATASPDPENEAEIQQAISRLVQDHTVVVITHRLKTVVGANAILVLDHGRITEQGTHNQLPIQNGLYAKLWRLQTSTEGWKIN